MTIGEKIRYFRERIGITQSKLAELTGIHPVSIRKYETNKMQPQAQQINRIADALCVSSFAISGIEDNIRLETVGDLMGLLILLCKTRIILIEGKREESGILKADTVSFKINPLISKIFKATAANTEFNADDILYSMKSDDIFDDILRWEKVYYGYQKCAAKYSDTQDKATQNALQELETNIETIEMELQRSMLMLDTTDGLKVKVPIYFS